MSKENELAFKVGYVMACCNLQNLFDQPTMAAEILGELGLSQGDVDAMDLSEYDINALSIIRQATADDPIST